MSPASGSTFAGEITLVIIFVWSIGWKGLALYHAGKNQDKLWFIGVLLVNTLGLVEIAYLFYLSKHKITVADLQNHLQNVNKLKERKVKKLFKK